MGQSLLTHIRIHKRKQQLDLCHKDKQRSSTIGWIHHNWIASHFRGDRITIRRKSDQAEPVTPLTSLFLASLLSLSLCRRTSLHSLQLWFRSTAGGAVNWATRPERYWDRQPASPPARQPISHKTSPSGVAVTNVSWRRKRCKQSRSKEDRQRRHFPIQRHHKEVQWRGNIWKIYGPVFHTAIVYVN